MRAAARSRHFITQAGAGWFRASARTRPAARLSVDVLGDPGIHIAGCGRLPPHLRLRAPGREPGLFILVEGAARDGGERADRVAALHASPLDQVAEQTERVTLPADEKIGRVVALQCRVDVHLV